MTLAEAGEVFAYWEQSPPPHLILQIIARLLGWAPRPTAPPHADISAAPPPGLAVAPGDGLGMPEPLLDPVAMRTRNQARAAANARRNRTDAAAGRHLGANETNGCRKNAGLSDSPRFLVDS